MTLDMLMVLGILLVAIVLFITEWIRLDVVALGVVVALMLTNTISTQEALAGFSSTAVLTIAALFIVGGAIMETGLATTIGRRILQIAGTSEVRLIVVLMTAVAILSGFMSSTGTVAVLLPATIILAKNADISPSKLLIPLAFGSLLGGATTLIGTPPNIIVNQALRDAGLDAFGFFSFTPMGATLVLVGVLVMVFVGRHLLPDRRTRMESQRVKTPQELVEIYRLPDNLFRLRIRRGSPLVGQTTVSSGLRAQHNINVLKVMRPPEARPELSLVNPRARRTAVPNKDTPLNPDPTLAFQMDDILIVEGEPDDVSHTSAALNLGVLPTKPKDQKALFNKEVGVAEVLLPPRSSLVGKTLAESRFGSTYSLTVLGIQRPGSQITLDLKNTVLQFGDTLLVQGPWQNILALKQYRSDFIVMGQPESMMGAAAADKAGITLLILLGMMLLMIFNVVPVATASMLAGLLVVLAGCLTMDQAYQSIDWKSVVLIAGMLPMATALERVGLVDAAAQGLVDTLGAWGPLAVLGGLFLFTAVFTQVLSNTATTVVIAPIALAAAQQLDVSPYSLMMAVAMAASMAFASPVASPANTLVMGAGSYRFMDYARIGVPLILLMMIICMLVLPLLFPFQVAG